MCSKAYQFQGEKLKVKVISPINAEIKMCHIFRKGKATNFKLRTQMEHKDPDAPCDLATDLDL